MALMDDYLEECHPVWMVGNDILLPPDHDLCLGLLGQGVHEAMVKLGIVLGHLLLVVNVGLGMASDLIKCKSAIVVEEVDEILVRLERVFGDHQYAHPTTSDCLVFQGHKEDLDPMGFTVEGGAWECFDPGLVKLGSLWCGIVNNAVIGKCWS